MDLLVRKTAHFIETEVLIQQIFTQTLEIAKIVLQGVLHAKTPTIHTKAIKIVHDTAEENHGVRTKLSNQPPSPCARATGICKLLRESRIVKHQC